MCRGRGVQHEVESRQSMCFCIEGAWEPVTRPLDVQRASSRMRQQPESASGPFRTLLRVLQEMRRPQFKPGLGMAWAPSSPSRSAPHNRQPSNQQQPAATPPLTQQTVRPCPAMCRSASGWRGVGGNVRRLDAC